MSEEVDNNMKIKNRIKVLLEKEFSGVLTDIRCEISRATDIGDNYVGLLYTVILTGSNKQGTEVKYNLMAKLAPELPQYRKVIPIHDMYVREEYVYKNVIPNFIKLQEEANLPMILQINPKIYATTSEDCKELLIMDDMKARGFKAINHQLLLDYSHALIVLKEYGKLHALSYATKFKHPDVFNKWETNCNVEFLTTFHGDTYASCIRRLGQVVLDSYQSPADFKERSAFEHFLQNISNTYATLFEKKSKYNVLNHGDAVIRNLLFKYDDSRLTKNPTKVCIIDWQLARIGSPALDVLALMLGETDKQLRARYYTNLIEEYYNSLSGTLIQLGINPQDALPFEVLQTHLKKYAGFRLYGTLMRIAMNLKKPMDSNKAEISTSNMFEDHLSDIPDKYVQRVRDLVHDLLKYGYDI